MIKEAGILGTCPVDVPSYPSFTRRLRGRGYEETQGAVRGHQGPEKQASTLKNPWAQGRQVPNMSPGLDSWTWELTSRLPPGLQRLHPHLPRARRGPGAMWAPRCAHTSMPRGLQSPGLSPDDSGRNSTTAKWCLGNRRAFDLIIPNWLSPSITFS